MPIYAGLDVLGGVVHDRGAAADCGTRLIFPIEAVNILDELAVQKVQRNVLRANAGTFAAIGAATDHMERADDVEHLFLKAVCRRLVLHAGVRVVEHALFARAGRADITAGVAADAAGKLILPESEPLVRRHFFQLFHLVKPRAVQHLAVLAEQLVIGNVLFRFTVYAAIGQKLCSFQRLCAVIQRIDQHLVALLTDGDDAVGGFTDAVYVQHTVAGHADRIHLFTVKAMLGEQLVEAVGIAGLQKHQHLAVLFGGLFDEILGEVRTAEIVEHKIILQFCSAVKHSGRHIIGKLPCFPAEHAGNGSVSEQCGSLGNESFALYFLHRRSSNLLFSPRAATCLAKSFMVAANFAPSAALTHSTRVRSFSMPR